MQQAIPYRSWRPLHPTSTSTSTSTTHFNPHSLITLHTINNNPSSVSPKARATEGMVVNMVSENAVIVFARRGCCMSHVVKRLLLGLGVNPAVYEVDENDELAVLTELEEAIHANNDDGNKHDKLQFPAVFIGGKSFGGLDRLMAAHISGELVPILKQAGALWL